MTITRSFVISILLAALSMPLMYAQDLSSYRGFRLGMNLPAIAKQAGVKPSEAKLIYQRPAVVQELEWRPQSSYSPSAQRDPVEEVLFSFCNGDLYRIVVIYDQLRTEGLTDQDLIESISAAYVPRLLRRRRRHRLAVGVDQLDLAQVERAQTGLDLLAVDGHGVAGWGVHDACRVPRGAARSSSR